MKKPFLTMPEITDYMSEIKELCRMLFPPFCIDFRLQFQV